MPLEIWIFSRSHKFRSHGGVVAIAVAPETYGYADAQMYARKLAADYGQAGIQVSTLVRSGAAY